LSRNKTLPEARTSRVWWWIVAAVTCAVVALVSLLTSSETSHATAGRGEQRALGAYRPPADRSGGGAPGAGRAAANGDGSLTPALEARLEAAAHVVAAPAPTASGAPPPLPPTGPLPPALDAQRQQALVGWQRQAQQLLDECVARPAELRTAVPLNVFFAPPPAPTGLAPQQLAPVTVSIPPPELRRLWSDTDPDGLQECLERVRGLALAVPVPPNAAAQVLPAAVETLLIQL